MKIGQITLLLLTGILSFSAMAENVQDTSHEETEPFNSIRASGDVDIHIVSAPGEYAVHIDGEGKVVVNVINNTLYIHRKTSVADRLRSLKSKQADNTPRPVAIIHVDTLHELSYVGLADVFAENLNSALLDLNLNTRGKVELSGKIGLRDLQVQGSGAVTINGINSRDLAITMTATPSVELRGSANLKILNYTGAGQLNFNGVESTELSINGSGDAHVQLSGKVKKLKVDLTDNAHFNGKSLQAQQAYVQTYQQSLAQISVTNKQNTLASDESNIYYYQNPEFKADFMADDGSVLDMTQALASGSFK